ncbi:MAG TPA: hypothetical protein VEJ88_01880 [Dissulfurispiraceae bacterium]|nr:hypothetical protein [Dissulfurispiraceae bacterium]
MKYWKIILFAALVLTFQPAFADQRAYVEKRDGERALALVKETKAVRFYCAPCREQTSVLERVESAEIRYVGTVKGFNDPISGSPIQFWQLYINGKPVNLAYTYILQDRKWQNLAIRLSLPVEDVEEFLSESKLVPAGSIEAIANSYSGKYIRETNTNYESAEIVVEKLNNGKYHVTGDALSGQHTGELDFTSYIKNARIHYTQYKGMENGKKEYYVLDIIFNKNGLVAKEENSLGVFGMNVHFEGEYIKK